VALIALDPRTGEVKALVGGRDYRISQLNHVTAMRQPGSAFKPIVYATAINTAVEGGAHLYTASSIISDEPQTFRSGGQDYQPHNFHGGSNGNVPLRYALAHSLNIASVNLAADVGFDRVARMGHRLGLSENIGATPAVALGAYETTPLEIAGAYTAFANEGMQSSAAMVSEVQTSDGRVLYTHSAETKSVLDPRVAYIMVSLMQEVMRSGTAAGVRGMGFTLPAAGKTGTSRDGWFAGFTTELLCVVWVGFDDNRDLNLEGAHSALPIWTQFMMRASKLPPYSGAKQFRVPAGIRNVQVCSESGDLAGAYCPDPRSDVFIEGTEPMKQCSMHVPQPMHIITMDNIPEFTVPPPTGRDR